MSKRFFTYISVIFVLSILITGGEWILSFNSLTPLYHFILSIIMIFIIMLSVVYIRIYNIDHQINKLYSLVFGEKNEEFVFFEKVLKKIRKQVSHIKELQDKEIDFLNEQEIYRKDFLGNISHELKTPLFSIQGYVLTLIEGGINDIKIRDKYLDRINKSTERLLYIVRDLDMISELENGEVTINPREFNIVAATREVFDLLEMKAEKNNMKLKFDKKYTNIKVFGDLEKIEQVLINLIINAIKYSGSNCNEIIVSFEIGETKVKISVKDNGKGIPKQYLKRIFERFYRVEKSRNRNDGGSGLGLTIVRHIIEAHGEKIYVESEENKYTTFYFSLKKAT